jgi:biopolymer transport protein TolR
MSNASSFRGGRTRKFKADINVVPYIDVMLVLLVIFMVAAPLANPNVINLPTAGQSTLPPTQYIQVGLKPDASATISITSPKGGENNNETADNHAEIVKKLRSLHETNPDLPLLISADRDIKYNEVVQIISAAKKLGINRVGLATK